ncbi:MAG: gamma-glutamylcyclotransferase [Planctomycetota bacterium]|nr:MAG: gamma-glutamylcyclotransferase [Planctomycetota bacterium]
MTTTSPTSATWYLAYGSNMSWDRLRQRIDVHVLCHSRDGALTAVLRGWRLCFDKAAGDGSGYAGLIANDGSAPDAEGVLWPVSPAGLQVLDSFEGVPRHYCREMWQVVCSDGATRSAAVYIQQAAVSEAGLLPRRDYLNHILAGIDLLSPAYGDWLRSLPVCGQEVC